MKDSIPDSGLTEAVANNVDALALLMTQVSTEYSGTKNTIKWLKKEDMKKPFNIADKIELIIFGSSIRLVYPVEILGKLLHPSSYVCNLGVLGCHL